MASEHTFIPAKESAWFVSIFDIYCRLLFRHRFSEIHTEIAYNPSVNQKTIYFLNHNSWWDGLVPLLLNRKYFRQNARAMMEDKQLLKYKFFRKLGAFSVNLSDSDPAIRSLRYAAESMQRENSSLYIYPQGEIVPFTTVNPEFRKGTGWLAKQCPDADLVPVAIYIHTMRNDKPELHINVGRAVIVNRESEPGEISKELEISLGKLLRKTVDSAHRLSK